MHWSWATGTAASSPNSSRKTRTSTPTQSTSAPRCSNSSANAAKPQLPTPPLASAPITPTHSPSLPNRNQQPYDLVVTHFFLDCLTQPELNTLITRVAPTLTPGALWLISDFRIPAGPMRLPAKLLIRSLYLAFRLLTGLRTTRLPDHATPLTQAGLTRISHQHRLAGLLTTELWQT